MKIILVKLPKSLRFLLFVVFIFPHLNSFCQNFSYTNVHAKTVSFTSGITINKDDYSSSAGDESYTAPQWLSTNTTQSPVAYTSGSAPRVSATFTITCPNVPASVYIRGFSPSDTNTFASKAATISDSTFTYPATTGSKVFTSGVVRFFDPYTIKWEISFDAGTTWKALDSTSNRLYVTKGAPYTPSGGEACNYETVFYLSCKNANHQTADTAIISHVWQEFTDQITLNCLGDSIYYYKDWSSPNVTLKSLLYYRDGECYTWAYLFLALIKVQGIALTNNYVYVDGTYNFLVKNYSFSSLVSPNTYSNATDLPGLPGQCTSNPASSFNNHGIALVNGVYYDPSYGVKYGTVFSAIPYIAFAAWDGSYYYTDLSKGTLYQSISTY